MNLVKKQINLNVRNPNNYQIIHAMQGDNESIEITATIWDGNAKYTIDCDNITIDVISPSGVQNQLSVISHTINEVVFRLDKNVLAENGEHQLVIHFMNQPDVSLTTYPSLIYVTNAPLGVLSEGTITTITEYVDNKFSYDTTEKKIGTFLGKPLYKQTFVANASSSFVIGSGTSTNMYVAIDSSGGIIRESSSYEGDVPSNVETLVKTESYAETSGYMFSNPFTVRKDKTGYWVIYNQFPETIVATKIIITFYYTKSTD